MKLQLGDHVRVGGDPSICLTWDQELGLGQFWDGCNYRIATYLVVVFVADADEVSRRQAQAALRLQNHVLN